MLALNYVSFWTKQKYNIVMITASLHEIFQKVLRNIILRKKLKDHKRVHDLISKRCRTHYNISLFSRYTLFVYVFIDKLKQAD